MPDQAAEQSQSDASEMRALVGGMLGDTEQLRALDDGTIRTLSTVLLERLMFARQAGISFHGARDLYEILGYNRILTYRDYRARYARGGLAKAVVDAYPIAVWRGGAEVYEDENEDSETTFEKEMRDLEEQHGLWSRLQRAHTLASLSTYAVLLIGAPGDLTTELPKGKPGGVLFLTPFSGGGGPGGDQLSRSMAMNADCSIMTFDVDPASPRFGLPLTYQLKRTDLSSPLLQRLVHWTRIIHVADGLLGDEVYGTPALEAVWNLLDDLDKVTGGGAEAYWLRANAGLHLDVDKSMGLPGTANKPGLQEMSPAERKAMYEKAEDLQHQLQRVMVTRGVTATQLTSTTSNFKDPADAIITQIAGTKRIPKRILVGSEMGQLASGQDKDNWNTQVQDKRTSWAFPGLVKPLIDRLIAYGYLSTPKQFHVDWPIIEDLTEAEKADLALKMADVNSKQQAVVWTEEEIRAKCSNLDPLTDEQSSEGLSEMQKAEIAAKLALTNKEQGVTVFSPAEIRKIAYGLEPLPPGEEVPIGAPERISVTAPPPEGDDEPAPGTAQDLANPAKLKAAERATLRELEAAIEADDAEDVARILGLTVPGTKRDLAHA